MESIHHLGYIDLLILTATEIRQNKVLTGQYKRSPLQSGLFMIVDYFLSTEVY